MAIKEKFGEVSKKELINLGDNVRVTYLDENDNNQVKTSTGILIKATTEKITVNGTVPMKEINMNDISEIKKTNN